MGKLKAILGFALIFGGLFTGWNLIPPYVHNYEFQDDLDEIARRNSYTQKTDDDLRAMVIKQAGDLEIPLKEDQVLISRNGDGLGIAVHYKIHVDMVVTPVDLDFSTNSLNKRL
jgi:hypothetical protein